jgi:hypothetical protein
MNLISDFSHQKRDVSYLDHIKSEREENRETATFEETNLSEFIADCLSRCLWNNLECQTFFDLECGIVSSNDVDKFIKKAIFNLSKFSSVAKVSKSFFKSWPQALTGWQILLRCYKEKFEYLDGQKFSILKGVMSGRRSVMEKGLPPRWCILGLINNKPSLDTLRIAVEVDKVDECYRKRVKPVFITMITFIFFIAACGFSSHFLIKSECSKNETNSNESLYYTPNEFFGYICNHTSSFDNGSLGIGSLFFALGFFILVTSGCIGVKLFEYCQKKALYPGKYEKINQTKRFTKKNEYDTSMIKSTWESSSDASQLYSRDDGFSKKSLLFADSI